MTCNICPRQCNADRTDTLGFCQSGLQPVAAAVCVHTGEEPPLCGEKGICNVFFDRCNLQCIYCQNHAISHKNHPALTQQPIVGTEAIVNAIVEVLQQTENIVGFVTPTHYAHSIAEIVEELHRRNLYPTIVYNTGGYESVETLRLLAPYIDIYLPDFKYSDAVLAGRYSQASDYPQVALAALKEMYYQKGSALATDDRNLAYRGIVVRHLVLPGQIGNSIGVLDAIADISTNLHISLMAQYYPPFEGLPDQLSRTLTQEEYNTVCNHMQALGLHKGWVQELDSQQCYRPDFNTETPFR